jgi:predicted RecA/RadA family phage recombinase
MRNFSQPGEVITVTAPYALTSGQAAKAGAIFGVASGDAAAGTAVELKRKGGFELAAVTADTGAAGAKVYWDDNARRITTTAGSNTLVGCLFESKSGLSPTARVMLDGAVR